MNNSKSSKACSLLPVPSTISCSKFKGDVDWDWVVQSAKSSLGEDRNGYRSEFVKLTRQASVMN